MEVYMAGRVDVDKIRTGLLELYAKRTGKSSNPVSDPQYQYITIALIASSAALAIFGHLLTRIVGLTMFGLLSFAFFHVYNLPEHYREHNHNIDTIMGMLWVPGFIEYCTQDARSLYPEQEMGRAMTAFRRGRHAPRAGSASPRRPS